jgi:hypothetical protein
MQAVADYVSGLSSGEAEARKARGEINVPPPSPGRSYRQIVFGNVFSFINDVFYVLCLLLVFLGRAEGDRVDCGQGRDTVLTDNTTEDVIANNCEGSQVRIGP